MTNQDIAYMKHLLERGVVKGPVLELGAGYGGATCRELVRADGLEYFATDVSASEGVSFVADFGDPNSVRSAFAGRVFGSVLALNVLEHTFDPVRICDNALDLVGPRGALVIVAPAVWTLHDYPLDCCRLLPHWYEQYAQTRGLELPVDTFQYLGRGRVGDFTNPDGTYRLPEPAATRAGRLRSRVVQKLFNTYGRGMLFPSHLTVGAVFVKR